MKWFVHSMDLISLGRQIDFEKHTLPNKKQKLSYIVMWNLNAINNSNVWIVRIANSSLQFYDCRSHGFWLRLDFRCFLRCAERGLSLWQAAGGRAWFASKVHFGFASAIKEGWVRLKMQSCSFSLNHLPLSWQYLLTNSCLLINALSSPSANAT